MSTELTRERVLELRERLECAAKIRQYLLYADERLDVLALCSHWLATQDAADDGWRDISTAPRDGTKVLVANIRPDGSYAWMYVAWWRRECWIITENVTRKYYSCVDSDPTHWLPINSLPLPPTGAGEK